jgi:hypothetical protein
VRKDLIFQGLIVFFCFSFSDVYGDEIVLDDYVKGLSPKWEEKSFVGNTSYNVVEEDGILCIRALSGSSASALFYKIEYDPKEFPILTWKWKVRNILDKGNALLKVGDDYAARVYVVFPSKIFWRTRAINYIWANRLTGGDAVPNPFTSNAMMVAVESGSKQAGIWREERRNVYEDYKKYFGKEPPKVGAIAIMTDTDNTGEEAIAWYGPIRILSSPSE